MTLRRLVLVPSMRAILVFAVDAPDLLWIRVDEDDDGAGPGLVAAGEGPVWRTTDPAATARRRTIVTTGAIPPLGVVRVVVLWLLSAWSVWCS